MASHSSLRDKAKSDLINKLENITARRFLISMILTTVITYLAVLTVMTFFDYMLYEATIGGSTLLGIIGYLVSASLVSFVPIAILSSIIVVVMTQPLLRVLKRNEKGEKITEAEFFAARKRTVRIPQIIFILNLIFPTVINIISGSFSSGAAQGITLLLKDISVFILAALAMNSLYQRLLSKPRAIMKIYTVDPSARNWFVENMDRIQLYISVAFMALVIFHSAMAIVMTSSGIPAATGQQELSQGGIIGEEDKLLNNSLEKMRQKMKESTGTTAAESITNSVKPKNNYLFFFVIMILTVMGLIKLVETIVRSARLTQTRILQDVLGEMAQGSGDLTKRVLIVQADETGILSHQLNMLLDRLQTMFRHITEQTKLVAESSSAVSSVLEATVAATEEMAASVSQINSNTSKNRAVVEQSESALEKMLLSLDQINSNVNTQAAYVEQTSSAMTEMIANIKSVNEVTSKANDVSAALKKVSDSGGQAVLNSIKAVKDIEESSNEVNSLVQIISKILAATNMLAMNAAIEAAHAGDAGRGFAVVAEEVRNLADDSSSNLKTISENIKDVIDRVNRGVKLSETAGEALTQVGERTLQTTQLMSEVASAMQEQAAGANEVLNSINSLVEASGSINKLSDEQHQNNEKMKDNLKKTVNAFTEVQSATEELDLGNREILRGIEELKEVISKNEQVVAALQEELGGFKI